MANNHGKPSGINKSEGTGIPADIHQDKLKEDKELTDEFTDKDKDIADQVRTNNPNRNVDKEDATNAGGYKN